ncbi:MAG: extracellular solute-binding protein [Eubacteriales bacterium]|nr:extracellular solute-binding protein [Eubacteriales bacterium]
MMKKRVFAFGLASVLAAGSLTGYGSTEVKAESASGEKTTLRFAWWGGQERADMTNEAVELFMEKNPDIVVETSFYPWDSYWENLSIASTANNVPDVYQGYIGAGEFQQFMDGGIVEPLDAYVDAGQIDISSISENLVAEGKVNGSLYGLPFGINTRAMLVAPDMYEKANLEIPEKGYESWEALEEDLVKLKEATGKYAAADFVEYEGDVFKYWCRQHGETVYAPEGDSLIGFSKDTFVDFYEMKVRWADEGLIPPYDVSQAENGPEDNTIVKGESAVNIIPASQYANFADAAQKELKMILLPGATTGEATMVPASLHLCMSSKSENKEAAAKLIDFLINDEEANKLMKAERGMPASDKARAAMEPDFNDNQKKVLAITDEAVEYSSANDAPAMEGSSDIQKLIQEYEERIMYKDVTPEEAYEAIAEAAQID